MVSKFLWHTWLGTLVTIPLHHVARKTLHNTLLLRTLYSSYVGPFSKTRSVHGSFKRMITRLFLSALLGPNNCSASQAGLQRGSTEKGNEPAIRRTNEKKKPTHTHTHKWEEKPRHAHHRVDKTKGNIRQVGRGHSVELTKTFPSKYFEKPWASLFWQICFHSPWRFLPFHFFFSLSFFSEPPPPLLINATHLCFFLSSHFFLFFFCCAEKTDRFLQYHDVIRSLWNRAIISLLFRTSSASSCQCHS